MPSWSAGVAAFTHTYCENANGAPSDEAQVAMKPSFSSSNAVWLCALAILTVAALAQAGWYSARLPERVATHFEADGVADGWGSRMSLVLGQAGISLAVFLLFAGIGLLLPRLPDAFINLPHKDHWLAPERRAQSLQRVRGMLLRIGCATAAFLLVLFQLIYAANRAPEPRLSPLSWLALALFLAYVAVEIVAMLLLFSRRFRR
ncbi:MAG: DUF1648 domain-containing protein [Planctomycetota bacterium]|nr:MAG: DUF1648 domain-containing protein [Planctomycetota bacterium]